MTEKNKRIIRSLRQENKKLRAANKRLEGKVDYLFEVVHIQIEEHTSLRSRVYILETKNDWG